MSGRVQQEEECERKGIACERIAGKLAAEDTYRRVYSDLAAKWRENAAGIAAAKRRETNVLRDFRRRVAGEDTARAGLTFVCRNALAI